MTRMAITRTMPGQLEPGPADAGLLAWSFDSTHIQSASALSSGGVLFLQKMYLQNPAPITNVVLEISTGGTTLTSAGVAVYQNGQLLGQSADQATSFQSAAVKTIPLTGGPYAAQKGAIYVAVWANGAALPQLRRGANLGVVNGILGSAYRYGFSGSGITTTAPGTLGAISATSLSFWSGVS